MVRPGIICRSNIIQSEKIILMYLEICNNILVKKEIMNLKERRKSCEGGDWREEGEADQTYYIIMEHVQRSEDKPMEQALLHTYRNQIQAARLAQQYTQ